MSNLYHPTSAPSTEEVETKFPKLALLIYEIAILAAAAFAIKLNNAYVFGFSLQEHALYFSVFFVLPLVVALTISITLIPFTKKTFKTRFYSSSNGLLIFMSIVVISLLIASAYELVNI